jgi:hypothetical protein
MQWVAARLAGFAGGYLRNEGGQVMPRAMAVTDGVRGRLDCALDRLEDGVVGAGDRSARG